MAKEWRKVALREVKKQVVTERECCAASGEVLREVGRLAGRKDNVSMLG